MGLAELRADAKLLREEIAAAETVDVKHQLSENIIPLFEALLDAMQERDEEVADLGNAVDELMDQTEDVIHPETAAKMVGVLEVGKLLANELEAALPKLDDVGKKRVKTIIKAYRQGAVIIGEIIKEITLVDDEEDEDPDERDVAMPPNAAVENAATHADDGFDDEDEDEEDDEEGDE